MKSNEWMKPLDQIIPYLEWDSIDRSRRTGWESLRHSNSACELFFILEGSCRLEVREEVLSLESGMGIFILPGTFHCCESITKPFLRFPLSFVTAAEEYFPPELAETGYRLFALTPEMRSLCESILRENDQDISYLGNEMLTAQMSQLVILFLRLLLPERSQKAVHRNLNTLNIIDKFFADHGTDSRHSRKALADQLHCSERQLNRIIEANYHTTFLQKRLTARIDYAKYLLRSTSMSIADIGEQVGYANEASFYKMFREMCGQTPSEFRKQHR